MLSLVLQSVYALQSHCREDNKYMERVWPQLVHFLVHSNQPVQTLVIEFFREVMVMKVEILNYQQPQDYLLILIEGICKVEGDNTVLAQLIVLL